MSASLTLNMPLIIRADASTMIGAGHVMRCLALSQAWQERGGRAVYVMGMPIPTLETRLQSEKIEVLHVSAPPGSMYDAKQTLSLAQKQRAGWVVLDGYHFGSDYQRLMKESGLSLLVMADDGHADHYYADIVLNQNIHAHAKLYAAKEPYTQLLLGTRYVLLRREFWPFRGWKRELTEVPRKLLITLGGADPHNYSENVLLSVLDLNIADCEITLIIGGANPNLERIKRLISETNSSVRLLHNVNNISELMAWTDIAISSGGSTVWELAFMGVPSLAGKIAAAEEPVINRLHDYGLFIDIGWFKDISRNIISEKLKMLIDGKVMREKMSLLEQELVDGYGCDRVINEIMR